MFAYLKFIEKFIYRKWAEIFVWLYFIVVYLMRGPSSNTQAQLSQSVGI